MEGLPTWAKVGIGVIGAAIAITTGVGATYVATTMAKSAIGGAIFNGAIYGVSSLVTGHFDKTELINSMLNGAADMFMVSGVMLGAKGVVDSVVRNRGRIKSFFASESGEVSLGKGGSDYYQDANGRWHRPNGQFASNAEMGIQTPVKTTAGTHGNSLSDPRTNYGYALVDKDTNEILKFGETLYPDSRYSQNFLDKNNAKMIIMEQGSKADIHYWQHDMNEYYFDKYDEYPPLNSKGW